MKVLSHLGSNFPERDGGGIVVKARGSIWLFHTEGGSPGEELEVEAFELGADRGYKVFAARLGAALGYSDDPTQAISEVGDDIGVDTEAEIQRLASSVDGRAEIIMRLGKNGWWADLDDDPSHVPYEHVARTWAAIPKTQRRFKGSEFAGMDGPYELVYSTGGHGGPYQSMDEARKATVRLMRGGNERWIAVIPASDVTDLTTARALWILKTTTPPGIQQGWRTPGSSTTWTQGPQPLPSVNPHAHYAGRDRRL